MAEENQKPSPQAFFLEGGPLGAFLIHGFTGSPTETRLVGDYLNQRGITVSAPRLPGHGVTVDELNRCRWTDWSSRPLSLDREWVRVAEHTYRFIRKVAAERG